MKTIHTILPLAAQHNELLNKYCELYNKTKHKAFALISTENKTFLIEAKKQGVEPKFVSSLTQNHRQILAKSGLNSRMINSINFEIGMIVARTKEEQKNRVGECGQEIEKIKAALEKYKKENKNLNFQNIEKYLSSQLGAYKKFLILRKDKNQSNKFHKNYKFIFHYDKNIFKNSPHIIKNEKLVEILKTSCIDKVKFKTSQIYCKNLYQIKILNEKLLYKEKKLQLLQKDIENGTLRVCFGSKALFNQQNMLENSNLSAIKYTNEVDWKKAWQESRNHQFLLTGNGEEPGGNQNCTASINDGGLFDIKLRLPNVLNDNGNNFIILKDVDFGKYNGLLKSQFTHYKTKIKVLTDAERLEIKALKNQLNALKKKSSEVFVSLKKMRIARECEEKIVEKENALAKIQLEIDSLSSNIKIKEDIFMFDKNDKTINTRNKQIGPPITYRFVRNIDRNSSKYGTWQLHCVFKPKEEEKITNSTLGVIGIDLNYDHLSVSETDGAGKLLQSFNLYLNPHTIKSGANEKSLNLLNSNTNKKEKLRLPQHQFDFTHKYKRLLNSNTVSSNKIENILGNALTIITDLSKKTGKPIAIEHLDMLDKKRNLLTKKDKNYNKYYSIMITSFAYGKFKSLLESQCAKKGLEIIEINPMFSSLIGITNYVKSYGLSIHMAASYVIARRALFTSLNNKLVDLHEKIETNKNNIEIFYHGKVMRLNYVANSSKTSPFNQWQEVSKLYKEGISHFYKEKLMRKNKSKLSKHKNMDIDLNIENFFNEDYQMVLLPNNSGNQINEL